MLTRVFKSIRHPNNRASNSNAISPHDRYSDYTMEKGDRQLRVSKSYGDIRSNLRPSVQPIAVNVEYNVEYNVEKSTYPTRDFRPELEVEDMSRERIKSKLKQSSRVEPKKSVSRRLTKRIVKNIVLEKFETLAAKNPDFKNFLESNPGYLDTIEIDELREMEYSRLDKLGQVYLDYTGGSLYPESLVKRHAEILIKGVFGNPHSSNPTSSASTAYEAKVRNDILDFFGADPNEYDVILTNNASGALKLVGESYPFSSTRKLLLTWDAHNSVNGIREFATKKGGEVIYVRVNEGDVRVDKGLLKENLDKNASKEKDAGLFILTGQSNVTGVKADLSWVRYAKARGWDVMLDASALAPTTPINLSKYPVDFMAISFYKMFGYPTGIGCLVIRREVDAKLQRPWFGGGTVDMVAVPHHARTLGAGHKRFEDGTLNYLSLSAVSLGLAFLRPLQKSLSDRVAILIGYLIKELSSLRHESTGSQLVQVTGPKTTHLRGGTISFYLTEPDGTPIPHMLVEDLARKRNISLRAGCMCNPGAMNVAMETTESLDHVGNNMSIDDFIDSFDQELVLLQRVSIGLATNWEDCYAFVQFCKEFLDPVAYQEIKEEFGVVRLTSLC